MTKSTILKITAGVMIFGALFSCGDNGGSAPAAEKHDEGEAAGHHDSSEETAGTASLTGSQMVSIGIQLGPVEMKQITATLKTNGVLKVPNQNRASVSSVYSGVIRSILVQPGSRVVKGQTIATVSNPDFMQAQTEYVSLSPRITLAELEVKRQQELNAGNAGALKNLQAAETQLKTLRTTRSAYAQTIHLMGINPTTLSDGRLVSVLAVKSPINGIVSAVKTEMGAYVDVSAVVAEIVDNSQLHLDLFVYEKDIPKLQNNQTIHFTLTNNPGKEYDAQVYSLGTSFEGESQSVAVHAKVLGDKTGLIDGMTITAIVSLNQVLQPAVPDDAIVNEGGKDFIFAVKDEAVKAEHNHDKDEPAAKGLTFEKVPVVKGAADVGYTAITLMKELPKEARIVTKGAFFILAKMSNTGGHQH